MTCVRSPFFLGFLTIFGIIMTRYLSWPKIPAEYLQEICNLKLCNEVSSDSYSNVCILPKAVTVAFLP